MYNIEKEMLVKAFDELTTKELYTILRLRSEVFVVEQSCIYLDLDNKDQQSHHVLLYKNNHLVAYSRVLPAGLSYKEVSFGRVLVQADHRGEGWGKIIIEASIQAVYRIYGHIPIKIGAQYHLRNLYETFGFIAHGERYVEDGITHIDMYKAD